MTPAGQSVRNERGPLAILQLHGRFDGSARIAGLRAS